MVGLVVGLPAAHQPENARRIGLGATGMPAAYSRTSIAVSRSSPTYEDGATGQYENLP